MKVTDGTLPARARQLGQEHRAAGIAPFGDADYVYWDAGSADLMAALGETGPAAGENYARRQLALEAYCDALEGGARPRAPLPLVTPEQRRLFAAALERALAREGLPSPATGGSR